MLGAGYILGSDLVGYIGRSQHLMRYYDWEDVTIGAHLGFIKDILFKLQILESKLAHAIAQIIKRLRENFC